ADAAFVYQREIDARRKLIVGVNACQEPDEKPLETLVIDDKPEREQRERLRRQKAQRDNEAVRNMLDRVKKTAATNENMLPVLIEAARARCTVGEIMNALADVFGRYDGAAKW